MCTRGGGGCWREREKKNLINFIIIANLPARYIFYCENLNSDSSLNNVDLISNSKIQATPVLWIFLSYYSTEIPRSCVQIFVGFWISVISLLEAWMSKCLVDKKSSQSFSLRVGRRCWINMTQRIWRMISACLPPPSSLATFCSTRSISQW